MGKTAPTADLASGMNVALVFGCARSGTSILGELIAAHPQVKYVFEAHDVWNAADMGENESHRLTAAQASPSTMRGIRQWFQQQCDGTRLLVEKNPRSVLRIPLIREVMPEARLVHIVRDGRDVACSMVPGCGGSRWEHLKPPSWQELSRREHGAVRCAFAWKEIMDIALADLADQPHLQVRYEDLVRRPRATARSVMEYLRLEWTPSIADFCEYISNDTAGTYQAKHQLHWSRADHRERIGRWRENLTVEEQRTINDMLAPLLDRLGYV